MSFKIHTRNGQTTRLNLADEEQAELWLERFKDPSFQEDITGISIVQKCEGHFRCPVCERVARLSCSNCGQPANETVCGTGTQYTVSKPNGFGGMFFHIEHVEQNGKMKGGEKVTCFVDNVRLNMMIHAAQPSARITLLNTGKQRFNPFV